MTTHPGLLAAIIAEPERDDLRLIYADAVEDEGDSARAEFIRVQVELAQLPEFRAFVQIKPGDTLLSRIGAMIGDVFEPVMYHNPPGAKESIYLDEQNLPDPHREKRQRLERREKELFWNAGPGQTEWFGAVHATICPGTDVSSLLPWYTRGFISSIILPAELWLAHADAITAQHPIEAVELTTFPECVTPFGTFDVISVWKFRWPRIKFTLPSATDLGSMDYHDVLLSAADGGWASLTGRRRQPMPVLPPRDTGSLRNSL